MMKRNRKSWKVHPWPALPFHEWRETRDTLHMWTQIVGKIRLELTPKTNHWWNVPLYVTALGLTTSAIPFGDRSFDAEFDFFSDVLRIRTCDGLVRDVPLAPRSVADFYAETMSALKSLGIDVEIWPVPVEIPDPIPFHQDQAHRSYDRDAVQRFHHILSISEQILFEFRARFLGKCSPVHFFWGSFDLAVTRFSGRPAPEREGADAMTREAYSHEVSSVGFWPGDSRLEKPSFYSYASPEPHGLRDTIILPPQAYYNAPLGGFYLHYDDVRLAPEPATTLIDFCQSTYAAAANQGNWDRAALERGT